MNAVEISERRVPVWGGRLALTVQIAGDGPPLVYLHAAGGMMWDPFLAELARSFTIYAPLVPGTVAGEPDDIGKIDDLWDLVLVYEEGMRELGVEGAPVIGQSFGGMLACELAAHFPALCGKLVLLAPIGLWLDEHPVANWVALAPQELPNLLFLQPESEVAQAMFTPPADPEAAIATIVAATWATGCISKFVWPVPDKGLAKRIHRVAAPTLVIWGKQDALISSAYAAEFARLIPHNRVEIIDQCGHIPQLEQAERTLALVRQFLA
jgi:pimeloyl-ACP methyl ester carboxylesterase